MSGFNVSAILNSNEQRNHSYSSSTSHSSNHSLATQSLRNLNINGNRQKDTSPILNSNTQDNVNRDVEEESSPSTSTTLGTPPSSSKYGSISQFDSLQTLLEQAGYKDVRVLTPTSKVNSNALQEQQRKVMANKENGTTTSMTSRDAIRSLESLSNRNNGNGNREIGDENRMVVAEKKGWISRFSSWTGSSNNNNNTTSSNSSFDSTQDKENRVSISNPSSSPIQLDPPTTTSTQNQLLQSSSNSTRIQNKVSDSKRDHQSLPLLDGKVEIDDIQTRSESGFEVNLDSTSSSSNSRHSRKSSKKVKDGHSISGIKRSSSPTATRTSSSKTPSPSPSKRHRTRPIPTYRDSSPTPSPTKSKRSNSSSNTTRIARNRKPATRNNLWLASIAHHQMNLGADDENNGNGQSGSSKTVPSRIKAKEDLQGELRRMFASPEKEGETKSGSIVGKKPTSPSKSSAHRLPRSSTSNSIDKDLEEKRKRKSERRPIPHTVSAIKGSGSGLRTIGTRALLRGGVGLGLGIGLIDDEKKEELKEETALGGMKKSKSKGRISLLEAFDSDDVEGVTFEEREEWRQSLKSLSSNSSTVLDPFKRESVQDSDPNPHSNSNQKQSHRSFNSPSLSPFSTLLLSSSPAEPILSHRAAVALRNSECLNLKPTFSLGIGLNNLKSDRGMDSLRGLRGIQLEEESNEGEEARNQEEGMDQVIQSASPDLVMNSDNLDEMKTIRKMNSIETLRKALKENEESKVSPPTTEASSSSPIDKSSDGFSIFNQTSKLLPSFSEAFKFNTTQPSSSEWDETNNNPQSESSNFTSSSKIVTSSPPTLTITSPRGLTSPKVLNLASDEFKPKSFSPDTLLRKEMKIKPGVPGKRKKSRIPMAVNGQTSDSKDGSNNDSAVMRKTGERGRSFKYSSARELAQRFENQDSNQAGDSKILPRRKRSKSRENTNDSSTSTIYSENRGSSKTQVVKERPLLLGRATSSSPNTNQNIPLSLGAGHKIKNQIGSLSGSDRIHQLRRDLKDRHSDPFKCDEPTSLNSQEAKKMSIKMWKSKTLPHRFENPTKGGTFFEEDSSSSSALDSPTDSPTLRKSLSKSKIPISLLRNDLESNSNSNSSELFNPLVENHHQEIVNTLPTSISGMSDLSDYKGEISPAKLDKRLNRMSIIAYKMNALAARNNVTPDQSMEDLGDLDDQRQRVEQEQESPIAKRKSRS